MALIGWCNYFSFLDSVAPCGATLSSKTHGLFLYVTHQKGYVVRCLFKEGRRQWPEREIRQASNSVRSIFCGGGGGAGVLYRGGNSERC